ncbi:hypothetical protein BDP27DRAFT_1306196 [Rhodocollybia butyracea]|uniref:Uncharacterized protein n=1 Tax=Rhodocollybia butyracea TaxID=206335 RepID=A0A9P5TX24_9AGAR|nr:hypothetical protein BDP27DRAFT_1306196 [Rhodocollybia butyracea]
MPSFIVSDSDDDSHIDALIILYHSIGLVAQTFIYGIYTCLMPISTFVMLQTGLQTPIRKFLLGMTILMYCISSVHWILSVVEIIQSIQIWFLNSNPHMDRFPLVPLISAIALVNYILTDGVVVWRAWVLCNDSSSRALKIPMAMLCCLFMSVTATIVIRILLTSPAGNNNARLNAVLERAIDATQITTVVLSLLANISSTSIIGVKAWKYRQGIKKDFECLQGKKSKADKVLVILFESGVLYIFSGIMVLTASLIRLPHGTLGDIYTPVNFQIAGIYPLIILLLVNRDSPLKKSVFATTIPMSMPHSNRPGGESHLRTIRFGTVGTVATMDDDTEPAIELDSELSPEPHAQRRSSLLQLSSQSKTLPEIPGDLRSLSATTME